MSTRKRSTHDPRQHSSQVVDGLKNAPARAMLRAVGFTDADFARPQVGVASTWANLTPCNMHINRLAEDAGGQDVQPAVRRAVDRLGQPGQQAEVGLRPLPDGGADAVDVDGGNGETHGRHRSQHCQGRLRSTHPGRCYI